MPVREEPWRGERCPETGFAAIICVCARCRPDLVTLFENSVCSCGERQS